MKRLLILALALIAIARAVTVQGNITDPRLGAVSGSCTVQNVEKNTTLASGIRTLGAAVTVTFTGGYLTVTSLTSGQSYRVYCRIPRQQIAGSWLAAFSFGPQFWTLPVGAGPHNIEDVTVAALGDAPGGGGSGNPVVYGEAFTLAGSSTVTLGHTPVAGTLAAYRNGLRTSDYSLAGAIVTISDPVSGDVWVFDYEYTGSAALLTPEIESITPGSTSVALAHTPAAGTLRAFWNGLRMAPTLDYTLSGSTVAIPSNGVGAPWTFTYSR